MMRVQILLLLASTILVGCGSMSGLDEKKSFACKAPPGISCASLSGVYANAIADNLPGSKKKTKSTYVSAEKQNATDNLVGEAPQTGTPLLSEPKVLRVWIAPWEDGKKVLHDQAYLYGVVDPGHWQIAHTNQKIADQFRVVVKAPVNKAQQAVTPPAQSSPQFQVTQQAQ